MIKTVNEVAVWNVNTRIFHWVNVLCFLVLVVLGILLRYNSQLGFSMLSSKIALKQCHVVVGYCFVINLVIRLICGCVAKGDNSWKSLFTFPSGYWRSLLIHFKKLHLGESDEATGHSPSGKLSVIMMYLLFTTMAITGLVRAATDIYYPPLGAAVAHYVAKPGVKIESIKPYDATCVDSAKLATINAFKHPFGVIHLYGFYFLLILVILHLIAVIYADVKQKNGIISAMFTGRKIFPIEPE